MRRFNTLLLRTAFLSLLVASVTVAGSLASFSPGSSSFGWSGLAFAQEEEDPEMTFDEDEVEDEEGGMVLEDEGEDSMEFGDEPEPEPEPEPEGAIDPDGDSTSGELAVDTEEVSWQDIVVVVRKPFLKVSRIELMPSWGVTMNDNIIRHVQFT